MFFIVLVFNPKAVNMRGRSQRFVEAYKTQERGGQISLRAIKNQEEDDDDRVGGGVLDLPTCLQAMKRRRRRA
jgi:hypothetical protein